MPAAPTVLILLLLLAVPTVFCNAHVKSAQKMGDEECNICTYLVSEVQEGMTSPKWVIVLSSDHS